MTDINPKALEVMNKMLEDIKRPEPVPPGLYKATVVDTETGESERKGTPFARLLWRLDQAVDVPAEALAQYEANFGTVVGKEVQDTYYLTDKSVFMLAEAMKGLGFAGVVVKEAFEKCPGSTGNIFIVHEAAREGDAVFPRVRSVNAAQ